MLVTTLKRQTPNVFRSIYSVSKLLDNSNRERTMKCMIKPLSRGKKNANNKHAAVLIALCPSENTNKVSILYTKRSSTLRRYSSQISFPGGLQDEEDKSSIDCALRECEEEIGLPRHKVEIWGDCGRIKNMRSSDVTPVVGIVRDLDVKRLKLNEHEVSAAFTICVEDLVNNLHHTQFRVGYSMPVFIIKPYHIWGLTAYITYNFLSCFLPPESNWHQIKKQVQYIKPLKLHNKYESMFFCNM